MQTQIINSFNFKGYDARPLKALVVGEQKQLSFYSDTINKLIAIGKKEGFDVFIQAPRKVINKEGKCEKSPYFVPLWIQDLLTFTPAKTIFVQSLKIFDNLNIKNTNQNIGSLLGIPLIESKKHIPGGNMFFIKENNKDSLIIGLNDYEDAIAENLQKDFNINNIYPISQPDYHIDLGIRPLKNKIVLVEDQEIMSEVLQEGIRKAETYLNKHPKEKDVEKAYSIMQDLYIDMLLVLDTFIFKYAENYKYTQKDLERYGFQIVKVPGVVRTLELSFYELKDDVVKRNFDFINAIVHERKDGSLVYITNSANESQYGLTPDVIKKIGFSFEEKFKQYISPFVAPEDVHFLNVDHLLPINEGGIKCLCAEVPM